MYGHGGLVSEKTVMRVRQIAEFGSYARFFFELIAMYLIVSGLAFCLIAAAYGGRYDTCGNLHLEKPAKLSRSETSVAHTERRRPRR